MRVKISIDKMSNFNLFKLRIGFDSVLDFIFRLEALEEGVLSNDCKVITLGINIIGHRCARRNNFLIISSFDID